VTGNRVSVEIGDDGGLGSGLPTGRGAFGTLRTGRRRMDRFARRARGLVFFLFVFGRIFFFVFFVGVFFVPGVFFFALFFLVIGHTVSIVDENRGLQLIDPAAIRK
jgi:hypothetical protein